MLWPLRMEILSSSHAFSLPPSPQNRSIQPEFQDGQTHASCVQRVGHQSSLALESSDIQPALQRGPQSPGPVPAPTSVHPAPVRGTERALGPSSRTTLQLALPHPGPSPVAPGTLGSRAGLRGRRGCFQESAGPGCSSFPSFLPGLFLRPPPLTLPLCSLDLLISLLHRFHCWTSASSQGGPKSSLSAFSDQLSWARLVPPAPTLTMGFWLASCRCGNGDPPTPSLSFSPGWREGLYLGGGVGQQGRKHLLEGPARRCLWRQASWLSKQSSRGLCRGLLEIGSLQLDCLKWGCGKGASRRPRNA